MKIAVIFLCLGIACFIDTSKGDKTQNKMRRLTKEQCQHYIIAIRGLSCQYKNYQKGPKEERKTREKSLAEQATDFLTKLAMDLGCGLYDVLSDMNMSPSVAKNLAADNMDGLLDAENIGGLLELVETVVEGVLCTVEDVRKDDLLKLDAAFDIKKAMTKGMS